MTDILPYVEKVIKYYSSISGHYIYYYMTIVRTFHSDLVNKI